MQSLVTNLLGAMGTVVVGASADIRRLQRTLELISAILDDAERRTQDETIKLWSKKLKEVLYDADDLMDRYNAVEPQAPSRSHIPKFGNWEAGAAPYTAYFDNARKGKTSPIQGSPVRTVMNPENSKLKHDQRSNREDEQSPLHPNYNAKSASKAGVALSSRERKGSTEGDGQAPNTPGRTRMRPGGRDDDLSGKGASVPRFGEWDELIDGDGYTDIFTKVRVEKQTGATKVSSNVQHHNPDNTESVSCGCFSFGKNGEL